MIPANLTKINNLEELKAACIKHGGQAHFFIYLMSDKQHYLTSDKDITYSGKTKSGKDCFEIFSSIDGKFNEYYGEELLKETNIGEAMSKGRFYCEAR